MNKYIKNVNKISKPKQNKQKRSWNKISRYECDRLKQKRKRTAHYNIRNQSGLKLDYCSIVNITFFEPINSLMNKRKMLELDSTGYDDQYQSTDR